MAKRDRALMPRLCSICGQFQLRCQFERDSVICFSTSARGSESFEMVIDRDLLREIRWKYKFFEPARGASISETQAADLMKLHLTAETIKHQRGAHVRIAIIPPAETPGKIGIDDFLLALHEEDLSGGGFTARQIAWPPPDRANPWVHSYRFRDSLEALMNSPANLNSTSVGRTLAEYLHRLVGGFRLERGSQERGNVVRWRSRRLATDPRRPPEPDEDVSESDWAEMTPATPASHAGDSAEDHLDVCPDRVVSRPPDPECEGDS